MAWFHIPGAFKVLAALLLTYVTQTKCFKILVFPLDISENTQFNNMVDLAITLAKNGHDITILTNNIHTPKGKMPENVTLFTYTLSEGTTREIRETNYQYHGSMYYPIMSQASYDTCDDLLRRKYILIQLQYEEFDLFMTDCSNICARVLVDYLQLPTILWCNSRFDIDQIIHSPIVHKSHGYASANQVDFMSRLSMTLNDFFYHCIYLPFYVYGPIDEVKSSHRYDTSLSVADVFSRVEPLILCNVDFSYESPIPIMPPVIPIAGVFFKDPSPLQDNASNFIKSSSEFGFVFVDFKSISGYIDQTRSVKLTRVLSSLTQKVVWKSPTLVNENLPPNMRTFPMLNENNVIGHSKIRFFVTNCDDEPLRLGIRYAVPILGVPFFTEQWQNCADIVQRHGIGEVIDATMADDDQIEGAIKRLLQNETYKENISKLAEISNRQLIPPKDKLLFWVDYVIRYKGIRHMHHGKVNSLSWLEVRNYDVIIFIVSFVILFLFVLLFFMYFCAKNICVYLFRNTARKLKYS